MRAASSAAFAYVHVAGPSHNSHVSPMPDAFIARASSIPASAARSAHRSETACTEAAQISLASFELEASPHARTRAKSAKSFDRSPSAASPSAACASQNARASSANDASISPANIVTFPCSIAHRNARADMLAPAWASHASRAACSHRTSLRNTSRAPSQDASSSRTSSSVLPCLRPCASRASPHREPHTRANPTWYCAASRCRARPHLHSTHVECRGAATQPALPPGKSSSRLPLRRAFPALLSSS